jgi:anti-sigma-K factor RskA
VTQNDDPARARERSADAAEFVLGTLDAQARADLEARLASDAELRAEIYAWQDRLLPLARRVAPFEPAPGTWLAIEARIAAQSARAEVAPPSSTWHGEAANDALWRRLRRWQWTGGLAMAASFALSVVTAALVLRTPEATPAVASSAERYLAVLQAPDDKSTGWVVEVAADKVRLVPVGPTAAVPSGRALQFWTKPEGAAGPTSLGLVRASAVTELPISRLPAVAPQTLFELTLEPETGSPIGRPTGPILYVGRSVRL